MRFYKQFKLVFFTLVIFCLNGGCENQAQDSNKILSNFNKMARESFHRNYDLNAFDPLNSKEKCILEKTINQYLDVLNDWKIIVIDSFYIRNYSFQDIPTDYSFISNKSGKFYFIYLAKYNNYRFGNELYELNNDQFDKYSLLLKNSYQDIVLEINSPEVDHFFDEEIFKNKDKKDQYILASHLLPAIFPYLDHEISPYHFLDSIKKSIKNNNRINSKIDSISKSPYHFSERVYDFQAFQTDIGIIIVDFSLNKNDSGKIKMNLYFIPQRKRSMVMRDLEVKRFKECN